MKPRSSSRPRAFSLSYRPRRMSKKIRDDVEEHEQVEDPDEPEERARDARADVAAVILEQRDVGVDRLGRDREAGGEREDDRRVAEREEEPDPERALAFLEELPGRVVDRGDVVGVERVPEAEGVGEHPEAGERGVVARVEEEQPPAGDVQEHDRPPKPESRHHSARVIALVQAQRRIQSSRQLVDATHSPRPAERFACAGTADERSVASRIRRGRAVARIRGMETTSAAQRRRQQTSAIVSAHPRWRGVRHPQLLTLSPTRFSSLDMLPAVERARTPSASQPVNGSSAWKRRVEQNGAIVDAHPCWRGITHPERLFFPGPLDERSAQLGYRGAVTRALARVRESEALCARIDAVAGGLDHRRWSWSTSPAAAPPRRLSTGESIP